MNAVKQLAWDASLWAACIVAVAILGRVGAIQDVGFALAGGALWFAIRKRGEG